MATAVDQIYDPPGNVCLMDEFDHAAEREGGKFAWLKHAGVAKGNAGRDFHGAQGQGCIPGTNESADANRLSCDD